MSDNQVKHLKDYQKPDFLIEAVQLTFELDDSNTTVTAVSKVKRNGQHKKPLVLDGEDLSLKTLAIDGNKVLPSAYLVNDKSLTLSTDLNNFELEIVVSLDPATNSKLEGLYKSGGAFCTQCEAEGFRRITYFIDRPDVLAEYKVKIIADKTQYPQLLANGNEIARGDIEDGKHWVEWHDPFKKPSYLFALVAGDFDLLEDNFTTISDRNIKLQIFVDKGNLDRAGHAMESLKKSMAWDEQVYGLEYDLDIYMIVAVDFFNMGAMENKGLNVFNSKFVLANAASATDRDYFNIESVIAHEYFHNWTGNRVTCRDWFQLSLKEGLTVFRDQSFSADMSSPTVCRIDQVKVMRNHQFAEDSSPMAHPIRPESVMEMNNFYTVTVYDKGAEVIRMMHTLLGADNYRKGMDLYFERFDGQAVTCDDFVDAMQDASNIDLSQFRLWYSQSGTPIVSVSDSYDEMNQIYKLSVSQITPETADQKIKQPLHIPLSFELIGKSGVVFKPEKPLDVTLSEQQFVFEGIKERPVPALFCDFSAPVKVKYNFSHQQLKQIITSGDNEFSRWDACQTLVNQCLMNAIAGKDGSFSFVTEVFAELLQDSKLDSALVAEMLELPSEMALAELMDIVDVDGIHMQRSQLLNHIATELADLWLACYQQNHQVEYLSDKMAVGNRRLKNIALSYLAKTKQASIAGLIAEQFTKSTNMTDTLAALSAARSNFGELFSEVMTKFDQLWQQDPLTMDKWFALHAGADRDDICEHIVKLKSHKCFTMQNPNRVRALIGQFVMANPYRFHQKDGSGYDLLATHLVELNSSNPQLAARLIEPFVQFRKHTEERQQLIKAKLEQLMVLPDLSRDLEEKITRALANK